MTAAAPRRLRPHVVGGSRVEYHRHDGRMKTNSGTAPITNESGTRTYQHAMRRCQHCGSRYTCLVLALHAGRFTCPGCRYDKQVRAGHKAARSAAGRERLRLYAARRRQEARAALPPVQCRQCLKAFSTAATGQHTHARYCSDKCRARAAADKQRELRARRRGMGNA